MKPLRVDLLFGTRPEAIKMAPLARAFLARAGVHLRIVVTGQHRQMLDRILSDFQLQPDVDLDLMEPGQTLTALTARTLQKLDPVLEQDRPDWVLVQGDTTTAFAGCLACFYRKIPVLHVEAGLRTGNLQSPWPEEANRVLISRLAQLHATPTATTQDQLLAEGIPPERIRVTGNTIVDALLMTLPGLERHPPAIPGLTAEAILAANEGWVLITGHRRENFGSAFESICLALRELALRYPQLLWIYPVHLNPNVREPVYRILSQLPNLRLLEPLGYREFLELFRRARLILSDSGGVQEEAPTLGVPVLLMRDTTERPEAVACGTVKLVGVEPAAIVRAAQALLDHPEDDPEAFRKHAPYGSGMASELIADWILEQPHPANHKL